MQFSLVASHLLLTFILQVVSAVHWFHFHLNNIISGSVPNVGRTLLEITSLCVRNNYYGYDHLSMSDKGICWPPAYNAVILVHVVIINAGVRLQASHGHRELGAKGCRDKFFLFLANLARGNRVKLSLKLNKGFCSLGLHII